MSAKVTLYFIRALTANNAECVLSCDFAVVRRTDAPCGPFLSLLHCERQEACVWWCAPGMLQRNCSALAQMPCVFIIALGRSGSSHLLRILNAIDGYRIGGETDNAWIHMGWFGETERARTELQAQARRGRRRYPLSPRQGATVKGLATSAQEGAPHAADDASSATICAMRRLMLQVHNPKPRARSKALSPFSWCLQ